MTEIGIYNYLKNTYTKTIKRTNLIWKIAGGWGAYSIVMLILLESPLWTSLVIFTPLLPLLYFMGYYMYQVYKFAKKFPLFYNHWKDQDFFMNDISGRISTRAQNDPNTVKITNEGLKYIDNLINAYGEDKQKVSNAFYNAIKDTNMVEEIKFYEKFQKFKRDMNVCKPNIYKN